MDNDALPDVDKYLAIAGLRGLSDDDQQKAHELLQLLIGCNGFAYVRSSVPWINEASLSPFLIAKLIELLSLATTAHTICFLSVPKTITSEEAADILGIENRNMLRLIENNKITHKEKNYMKMVPFDEVIALKEDRNKKRGAALAELARIDAEYL